MELPAPALRRTARLFLRNVHPHPAGPRRPPAEGIVNPLRQEDRTGNSRTRSHSLLALHGTSACTIPSLAIIREMRNSSARLAISTRQVTSTKSSAAFWPASSKKCGALWARRSKSNCIELGPGRGLFAQDVLDWSEKKFPDFFQCATLRSRRKLACVARTNRRDSGSSPRIRESRTQCALSAERSVLRRHDRLRQRILRRAAG